MGENEVRYHKSTLIYSGGAVIVFGIWGAIKLLILAQADPIGLQDYLTESGSLASLLVATAVDLLFRFYIGLSAIGEGKGKKKGKGYLILGGIYYVVGFFSYLAFLTPHIASTSIWDLTASFIIDATSCIAVFLIIRSSLHLRKLAKAGVVIQHSKASEAAEALR